ENLNPWLPIPFGRQVIVPSKKVNSKRPKSWMEQGAFSPSVPNFFASPQNGKGHRWPATTFPLGRGSDPGDSQGKSPLVQGLRETDIAQWWPRAIVWERICPQSFGSLPGAPVPRAGVPWNCPVSRDGGCGPLQ